jgi:hypothetical protein
MTGVEARPMRLSLQTRYSETDHEKDVSLDATVTVLKRWAKTHLQNTSAKFYVALAEGKLEKPRVPVIHE